MNIALTHPFLFLCYDKEELLTDCSLLNTYLNRLASQSPRSMDPDKYKGDGFELLAEAIIKTSPIDKRIAISNYQVVTSGDIGVDGHGIGINGRPATVQCKFRAANHVLTANADHLANFVMSSYRKFGVAVDDKDNMLIITSGSGLHHFTDTEMFGNQVRCLNREMLRKLLDNNHLFWNTFASLWQEAIDVNNKTKS